MEPKIPVTVEEDAAWEELLTKRILYLNEKKPMITVDDETWRKLF